MPCCHRWMGRGQAKPPQWAGPKCLRWIGTIAGGAPPPERQHRRRGGTARSTSKGHRHWRGATVEGVPTIDLPLPHKSWPQLEGRRHRKGTTTKGAPHRYIYLHCERRRERVKKREREEREDKSDEVKRERENEEFIFMPPTLSMHAQPPPSSV